MGHVWKERERRNKAESREEGRDIIYGAVGWVGAGVPCIDSTSFTNGSFSARKCTEMPVESYFLIFADIARSSPPTPGLNVSFVRFHRNPMSPRILPLSLSPLTCTSIMIVYR